MEVGTIFLWGKSTPPPGALELNGSTFDTDEYPDLYTHLGTDTLIDMRGEFLRGWANGRTVAGEVARVLGSTQEPTKFLHTYGVGNSLQMGLGENTNRDEAFGSGLRDYANRTGQTVTPNYTHFSSRPRNVALMFCIQALPHVGDTFEEKVVAALEKIAEGVYHVEDAGDKKPLARTIALLLAGLNINYCGD